MLSQISVSFSKYIVFHSVFWNTGGSTRPKSSSSEEAESERVIGVTGVFFGAEPCPVIKARMSTFSSSSELIIWGAWLKISGL